MQKRIFDRSKFKVTRDRSPTISGWLLVLLSPNSVGRTELIEIHSLVTKSVGKSATVTRRAMLSSAVQ